MSQENVEVVQRAVAALNERDIDDYLACCTEDVQLFRPTAQIEGAYEGRSGVRRFLADVQDAGPNFRLSVERLESIGPDRVLGFLQATMSRRASGIDNDFPVTNIYDLAMAGSGACGSSWTGTLRSKPPGCRSRRCRRRT